MKKVFNITPAIIMLITFSYCRPPTRINYPASEQLRATIKNYIEGRDLNKSAEIIRNSTSVFKNDPILNYIKGDIEYLSGDFESSMHSFMRAISCAAQKRAQINDLIARLSISTIETMRRYIPNFDAKFLEFINSVINKLYNNSDTAYFSAHTSKIRLLRRTGKFSLARKEAEAGGCLTNWETTGPFGNTYLLGFDKTFPPEKDISWRQFYKTASSGKLLPAKKAQVEGCWITLGYEGFNKGGTFYGRSIIKVTATSTYIFKVSTFSSIAMFIDGVEVIRADRRKKILSNSLFVKVKLKSGIHQIIVKISSTSSNPSFIVQWKESSSAILNSKTKAKIISLPVKNNIAFSPEPPGQFSRIAFHNSLKDYEELGKILLSDLFIIENNQPAARQVLKPLTKKYPHSFSIVNRKLIINGMDSYIPEMTRLNRIKKDAQHMRKTHPTIWMSYIYLSQIERRNTRNLTAIEILKEGMKNCPEYRGFYPELADIYNELGWNGEEVKALNQAKQVLKNTCQEFRIEYLISSKFEDIEGMEKSARKLHECDHTDQTIISILRQREKYSQAAELQREEIDAYPDDKWLKIDEGWSRFKSGDLTSYKNVLLNSFNTHPMTKDEGLHLIDIYAAEKDLSKALATLFKTLVRSEGPPSSYYQKIALLKGFPYLFHYRKSCQEAISSFSLTKKTSYKDTPAIEVLDHATHRIFDDGSSITRYHSVRKLLTREGVEKNGEFKPPGGAIVLKIRTIKPDGRIIEPEKISGKPSISYPSLEPGDFTETEWIQYTPPSSIFPSGTLLPRWYFQVPDIVLHRSELYVIAPEKMELNFNTRGTLPGPIIEKHDELKIYKWITKQMSHIRDEPNSPNLNEFLPSLQVSYKAGWDEYFNWVRDILVDTFIVTPEMKEKVEELIKDIPPDNWKEKAKAIFKWVSEEVEQGNSITEPVYSTFYNRRGDKSKLLYAMLTTAGIPAELHIAETIYSDKTESEVADFEKYTHFIIYVNGDWLIPTFKKAYYGFLPYFLYGQKTVKLFPYERENKHREIPQMRIEDDSVIQKLIQKLNEDGSSDCILNIELTGVRAALMRSILRKIPESERLQQVESTYLAANFTGASIVSLEIPQLNKPSDHLSIKIEFTIPPKPGPLPGSISIGPILKSRIANKWTQLPERKLPLLIDENINIKTFVTIDGGGKFKILAPPNPQSKVKAVNGAEFHQSVSLKKNGQLIYIEREIKIPMGRIPPEKYHSLLKFAGKVDESEGSIYLAIPLF